MNETKQRILEVSLTLFSQNGFSAVSIRDICKLVQIKESSIYYHFENKQAILNELLLFFQEKATSMMRQLETAMDDKQEPLGDHFYKKVCDTFFEEYLMDCFCNKMLRLMMIEKFNNGEIQKEYDRWLFQEPLKFQKLIFEWLGNMGIIEKVDSEYLAVSYYAPIFLFAQKWLFNGELSEENKNSFRADTYKHIHMFFSKIGGA